MAKTEYGVGTAEIVAGWRTLRPDLDPTSFSIIGHISRLAAIVRRVASEVSGSHGVTEADSRILLAIRGNVDGVRPSALVALFDLTRATMTYRTDRLLAKGLVRRSSDANDGRAFNVQLTPKGRDLIDVVMTEVNTQLHARLSVLDSTPGGRRALLDHLEFLVQNWEREDASLTGDRALEDEDERLKPRKVSRRGRSRDPSAP